MNSTATTRRIPIAWCPICKHTVVYSDNPRGKKDIYIFPIYEGYRGKSLLCSKCKTMLAVIDKAAVPLGYTVIPIYSEYSIKSDTSAWP